MTRWGRRAGLVLVTGHALLLAAEVAQWRKRPKSVMKLMERGLYVVEEDGPKLRAGARLQFDDGIARGDIAISTLGYRGHDPRADAADRVLLIGDSFAFGSLLDQSATIDTIMERLHPAREVINLGVTAYHLPEQLAPLQRWSLGGRHVVFLFHGIDLEPTVEQVIVDGYRVRLRRHPDGSPFSDAQMREATAQRIADIQRSRRLGWESLWLPRVRRAVRQALSGPRRATDSFRDAEERRAAVERGVVATEDMAALANERGMSLVIVIVPSLDEVKSGSYAPAVAAYVDGLRARGFSPVELIHRLSPAEYWPHDGHFNPDGARVVAQIVNAALDAIP